MSEQLPLAIMRARLKQLGTVYVTPGNARTGSGGFFAEIQHIRRANGWGHSEDEAVNDLYTRLSEEPSLCEPGDDVVAVWWDPRIQDWGTSPNAPEGWPTPAKDPEDIRARLPIRLEMGIKDAVINDYQDDSEDGLTWHVEVMAGKTCYIKARGATRDSAYIELWRDITNKR